MLRLKTVLATTVAVSLAVANITAAKIAQFQIPFFGEAAVPAGFIGIGVAFLATDLLSELYSKEDARDAVNAAIVTLGLGWALVYASIAMPTAPFYPLGSEFAAVLGSGATIVLASIVTLLVSQNVDVSVFHAIDGITDRKWARNIGSTAISQFIDTTLFIALGFVLLPVVFGGQQYTIAVAIQLIIAQYLVKLFVVAADTPFFYGISWLAKR
jgi:uncharacterized integral membrane protein (TIGR00697 family)